MYLLLLLLIFIIYLIPDGQKSTNSFNIRSDILGRLDYLAKYLLLH